MQFVQSDMRRSSISIVIDTNWWVSLLISKYKNHLVSILSDKRIDIYSSEELILEVVETITDPSLAKYIDKYILDEFIESFPDAVKNIKVKSKVRICRDHKDNFLLALSKDAKADYLITGDKDLLVIGKFGKTHIIKLTDFIKLLQQKN